MQIKILLAKKLMNLLPNRPDFHPRYFRQQLFRHPNYKKLSNKEKHEKIINWIEADITKAKEKPFESFFPDFPFDNYFRNKSVLDLGCGIGGYTINFAERHRVKLMAGIDVNEELINAIKIFVQNRNNSNVNYDFKAAYAEELPYPDNTFDAIISLGVLQHVRDIKKTLQECKRVVKKCGAILLVFIPYHFPLGGAHISSVTRTPFLEWFFSPETLNEAYNNIVVNWNDRYDWYKHRCDNKYGDWEKIRSGIGINGINYKKFNSALKEVGFANIKFIKTPLLKNSSVSKEHTVIRYITNIIGIFLIRPFIIERLSQRLVYILAKGKNCKHIIADNYKVIL